MIYLDHAATTPVAPEVLAAMEPWNRDQFGNPTTLYAEGVCADEAVEAARQTVAQAIGARPRNIAFTSGTTEAVNWALKGVAFARKTGHLIASSVEHSAVYETCRWLETRGFPVTWLPVDRTGTVDPDDLKRALRPETILVAVMHGNNEIGTVQPVEALGALVAPTDALFLVDAAQTVGHLPVDVGQIGCDLLAASGHKCYGPKGSGFLYIRSHTELDPLLHGGGQENDRRSGTHNVAGIIGLATAVAVAVDQIDAESVRLKPLAARLIDGARARIDGLHLNGDPERRLPGNVHLTFDNSQGEALVLGLDLHGISLSTGSACSSRSLEPSRVLRAIGLSDEAALGSVRMTLGRETTADQIDTVLNVLPAEVQRLRELSPRSC